MNRLSCSVGLERLRLARRGLGRALRLGLGHGSTDRFRSFGLADGLADVTHDTRHGMAPGHDSDGPALRLVTLDGVLGLGTLSRVIGEVRRDVAAAHARDPAARGAGSVEVLSTWPGVQALLAHRVAHGLHGIGVPLVPRSISTLSRTLTGIEIHPAAQIGNGFFVDHGAGVVIGETAQIGDDVTLFQGVTLGGTGFATGKRHPTLQDNVTVGAGAKLLGAITVGHGAKVGANSVVIHDVPPNTTVVGNPGHPVRVDGRKPEGPDVDWIHLPDPIADAIKGLSNRIGELERELAALSGNETRPEADVRPLRKVRGPSPAGG